MNQEQQSSYEINSLLEKIKELEKRNKDLEETVQYLKQSEDRLLKIADIVPHFIFIKDEHGVFIFANKALADSYNTTPEKLIGRKHDEIHNRDIIKLYLEDDLEVIKTNQPKFIPEEDFYDADGNLHIMQSIKVPFKIIESNNIAVLGVSVDVTELSLTTDALIESEKKLAEAQHLANIGEWEYYPDLNKVVYSVEVYKIFQINPMELGETPDELLNFIHQDDIVRLKLTIDQAIKHKTNYAIEYRFVHPDARIFYIHEYTKVIYNQETNEIKLVGTIRNISEQKQIEKFYKYYQFAIESSKDLIAAINKNLQLIFANKSFMHYFQIKTQYYSDIPILTLFENKIENYKIVPLLQQTFSGEIVKLEIEFKTRFSGIMKFEAIFYPLKDEVKVIEGAVLVFRKIFDSIESQ